MNALLQDLRYGLRLLAKSPGFTAVALLLLALGIGGNTAIFSLVNAVALRGLAVHDPSQLVVLRWGARNQPRAEGFSSFGDCERSAPNNPSGCSLPLPVFERMRSETKVFSAVTAFAGPAEITLSGHGAAQMIEGELVSGDYFQTLGVSAAAGRTLESSDDHPSASAVTVLSYAFWQKQFGGDPSVIGRKIRFNGNPFTIVGVADPAFTTLSPGKRQDLWLPISTASRLQIPWGGYGSGMQSWWLVVVARLRPGVSRLEAQGDANLVFRNETLHGSRPAFRETDKPEMALLPAQEGLTGRRGFFSRILNVLMCAVGLVLLIVCGNLGGLLLSRAAARQKEIALRLALGAGAHRIFRQLITEGLILSVAGAALGTLFAYGGVKAVTALLAGRTAFPFMVSVDWRVLIFTLSIAVFTGMLFAFAPAMQSARSDIILALKQTGSTGLDASSFKGSRFYPGNLVVIAQVSLSLVVLLGAGLLVRTLQNLHRIDPGFDTRKILLFDLNPSLSGYKDTQIQSLYPRLKERLAAIPGVSSVSYSSDGLLSGGLWTRDMHIEGEPGGKTVQLDALAIGPDFFHTMRIPLLEGRLFRPADFERPNPPDQSSNAKSSVPSAPIPVAVNAAFVRSYFSNQSAIGKRLSQRRAGPGSPIDTWEIIAVVGNTRYSELRRDVHPAVYFPFTSGGATFELKTALHPSSLIAAAREVVKLVDSNIPLTAVRTQAESIDDLLTQERVTAQLASFFGVLALGLTCFGIYGLLSYEVTRRTREIGIRMALGAEPAAVSCHVIGHAMKIIFAGVITGLVCGAALTRLLSSLLYGVTAVDPFTFLSVPLLLIAVAALACYIPARRATQVDPLTSLRYE